ncbi:hypothetical protein TRICI_003206 [Trichomonascus ciferrii]|uniref:Uncharacterized protein n=1 Tax=Trichomonascus ciferrii TaxID=44093 RepID=A0A642V4T3_9ASCO|nr:hypothetical protein TRICI_003206 [Trichomonascus ciferrii]
MDLNRYLPAFEFEVMDQDEAEDGAEKEKEEDFESFQLFSNSGLSKVRLESPEPEQVYAKRPDTYYFSKPSDSERRQIESVALSGQDVLELATESWPGMKMPWKVINFDVLKAKSDIERKRARQRPGKKAREQRKKRSANKNPPPAPAVYGPSRTYSNSKLPADKPQQRGRKNTRGRGRGRPGARFRGGGYPRKPGSG